MRYLTICCILVLAIGCKKEDSGGSTATDNMQAQSKSAVDPGNQSQVAPSAPSAESIRERNAIASYADFVKATKQLNTRLATGITHEELDEKAGTVIDGYALIDDPSSDLMEKAKVVVEQLKRTQVYWANQDQIGIIDRKAVPHFLSEVSKAIDSFQTANQKRSALLQQ